MLKISPERRRVVEEAAALARWTTPHVPALLAFDEHVGALLVEAIDPGPPLGETDVYPPLETIAELITALHRDALPDPSYEPVAGRIADGPISPR